MYGVYRSVYPKRDSDMLNVELKAKYGATETNNLQQTMEGDDIEAFRSAQEKVDWSDPDLAKIVRLRILSDSGIADVSYCWGVLKDGTKVHVDVPLWGLVSKGIKAQLIKFAQRDKVYLKGLGVFDEGVLSILY